MIISVGYRVNSKNATAFRRWATTVLKQYLIKGYVINQQLKLDRYNELKDVVRLMGRAIGMQEEPFVERRAQTHCRQHPRCTNLDDCREPYRGEGCNG